MGAGELREGLTAAQRHSQRTLSTHRLAGQHIPPHSAVSAPGHPTSRSPPCLPPQVSALCSRPVAACVRLHATHAPFLATVTPATAPVLWQYFLSAAREAASDDDAAASGVGGSATKRARDRDSPVPTPAKTAARTPRQRAAAERVRPPRARRRVRAAADPPLPRADAGARHHAVAFAAALAQPAPGLQPGCAGRRPARAAARRSQRP